MPANLDAINLDSIADPALRQQLDALVAEHRALRQNYLLVQREAQFQSHFLARISHELRSPLSGIIGSHQLVLEDLCEDLDEEHEFIQEANKAALKLVQMLDSLLLVSRIKAGRRPLKLQAIQLKSLLVSVNQPIQLEAENHSTTVNVSAEPADLAVMADKDLLLSLLIDLLELAIDVGQTRDARISLQCRCHNNSVEFCLISALMPEDFGDGVNFWEQYIKQKLSSDRDTVQQVLPNYALSPSLRLALNQNLLELMGGQLELPTPISDAAGLFRLRFWLPQVVENV